jgi:hypothetical protein
VAAKSCRGGSVLREGEPVADVVQACDLPGWTDLIWVIDVGADEPVIISATHGPDVTPAQEAELVGIVESASFVLP